jgi:hypothetical protein
MTTHRQKMKEKIAALRAKTRAAGCTEAEAMAAAELAAKLMAEHGLNDADMEMTEAKAKDSNKRATWRASLSGVIAYCTNTAAIVLIEDAAIMFVGRDPGPEIAVYLRDICFRSVERELRAFKTGDFYRRRRTITTKRQAAADYVAGMVVRLERRLLDLFAPLRDDNARAAAKNAIARRYTSVAHVEKPRKHRYSEAATAGYVAGGAVPLNRGVATPERKALA